MGVADRVEENQGDFVELQKSVPAADIVTLDRAICCYPAIRELLTAAGGHARQFVALTMPRRTLWMRAGIRLINFGLTVARKRFRVYSHPPHVIDATLHDSGFRKVFQRPPACGRRESTNGKGERGSRTLLRELALNLVHELPRDLLPHVDLLDQGSSHRRCSA